MRSLQIELRETDVDALIESGFLDERSRDDANAIIRALYKFFDDILIERRATPHGVLSAPSYGAAF